MASYLSADGADDVPLFYPEPLRDALPVKDVVCFWRPVAVYVDAGASDTSMPDGRIDATRAVDAPALTRRPPGPSSP